MQNEAFAIYLASRKLADNTQQQRTYALRRVEKIQEIDLDTEFERDGLTGLISLFKYTTADANVGRSNPTKFDIDANKLLTHLPWYRSHLQDYRRFKEAGGNESLDSNDEELIDSEAVAELVGKTFGLERDLQTALRENLDQLEIGLTVADGGSELKIAAGFVDILARDQNGTWTVIELKTETARASAVAQILAYMGCIQEEKGGNVRGILVAADHDARVKFAVRAVPALTLKKYRYRFEFV